MECVNSVQLAIPDGYCPIELRPFSLSSKMDHLIRFSLERFISNVATLPVDATVFCQNSIFLYFYG